MALGEQAAARWRKLGRVLRDPQRKSLVRIAREATTVSWSSRELPEWYFFSFAYRRDAGSPNDYFTRKQYRRLMKALRQRPYCAALENKLGLYSIFEGTGVALPPLLAHSDGAMLHGLGGERRVDEPDGLAGIVDELCALSASGSVFAKPVDGRKGAGCHRLHPGAPVEALQAELRRTPFLFQETLRQDPALDAVFPGSLNTIRVLTCAEPGAEPEVVAAMLRCGVGGSAVDNASQGGIFIGIELTTGRLLARAMRLLEHGGDIHAVHPDTGFRFAGFPVPQFNAILAVATLAATRLPHDLVGWDIAVTHNGPVLIEGNGTPHLTMMEIASGRGLAAHLAVARLAARLGAGRTGGSASAQARAGAA